VKEISDEEGVFSLLPSSIMLLCALREALCGRRRRVSSSSFFFFHVASEDWVGVDAQLLLVASTSDRGRKRFGVVVASGRSATTTSWMLEAVFFVSR
jgi:hypothetical protein